MIKMPARCRQRPPHPDLSVLAIALVCCITSPALATDTLAGADLTGNAADAEWMQQEQELYLDVTVNLVRRPALHRFVLQDGRLFAAPSTLRELGLRIPDSPADSGLLPVERDGITASYDAALQRLDITAPLEALDADTMRLHSQAQALTPSPAPPGLLLNYDLDAYRTDRVDNIVLAPMARLFGPGSVTFESSGVVQATSDQGHWQTRALRLDSRLRWTLPARALELIVGDTISDGPDWTRQTRLGGVRIGTNHAALQPYRTLSPGPVFSGESVVPSTVELYVNGIRQYQGQTPPGRFEVSGAPSMEGLGNARLVITDAFGRVRTIDVPFYGSQRLLAPGLNDWSVALGRVRLGYGTDSSRYAPDTALSASWRRGLTQRLTAEAHVEAMHGLRLGGLGAAAVLGRAGVLHGAWAQSHADGATGSQHAWGYQWGNGRFNIAADSVRTHGQYRDLAAVSHGFLPARATDSASIGVSSARLGNLNLTWVNLQYPEQPRSRMAGLYWSRSFADGWFLSAGGNIDLDDHTRSNVNIAISRQLDTRRHAGASLQRASGRHFGELNLVQQARQNGDVGWRLQARHDSDGGSGGLGEATWLTRAAELGGGVARYGGHSQLRAWARGGVLWMGRSLHASRQVVDGFVLVDAGRQGVPVKLENRPYGVTNRAGQLIVTPAFPFQRNRISIDPSGLPADVRVPVRDKDVVPGASGAARVDFEVAAVRAAVIVLHDAAGQPLPLGSSLTRVGGVAGEEAVVGYDGEVYLESLSARNVLRIVTPDGACIAQFDYPANAAAIPRIGPLPCLPENRP